MKSRRRRSFWRKFFLGLFLFIIVSFTTLTLCVGSLPETLRLLGMSAIFLKDRVCHTPPFRGKTRVNILMLGVDVPFGHSSRTDTIKFITIDLAQERISMLSIPRDTWVALPNGDHGRINTAHQLGGNDGRTCIRMAETAVQNLLSEYTGQPIQFDYYLRVQTTGFVKIIDAIGGIEIDVEKQMDYEDPSQNLFIHLQPGLQRLDGEQAMGYVRFRHDAEGDYGRIKRQDKFIHTLVAQLQQSQENTQQLARLIGPMLEMVSTNLTANDVMAIKRIVDKVGMSGVHTTTLPTVPTYRGRASVVEVEDPLLAAQSIHEVLFGPRPTVAILNGTDRNGLANDVSKLIDTNTFNVVGVGNTDAPMPTSGVFTSEVNNKIAERLADQLGLVTIVDAPPAARESDAMIPASAQIIVVLGNDYHAPGIHAEYSVQ